MVFLLILFSAGYGVEGELAAAMLGLGHGQGGCDGGGADDLTAVGADGLGRGSKAGDEIAKGWHRGSNSPDQMGSIELSAAVHTGLELHRMRQVV